MSAPNKQSVSDFVFFALPPCRKCTWEQGLPHQNTTAPALTKFSILFFLFHLYVGNNNNNIKQRPILKKRVVLDQSYTLGCTKEGNILLLFTLCFFTST